MITLPRILCSVLTPILATSAVTLSLMAHAATPTPDGDEATVYRTFSVYTSSIPISTALNNGHILVSWMEYLGDSGGGELRIYAKRVQQDGSATGTSIVLTIDQWTRVSTANPLYSVVEQADGTLIFTWSSKESGLERVYAQRFSATGSSIGSKFLVSQPSEHSANDPYVETFSDGRFMIAWAGQPTSNDTQHIYARYFNADGSPDGNVFQVDVDAGNFQGTDPIIRKFANDSFIVSWRAGNGGYIVNTQRLSAGGSKEGPLDSITTPDDRVLYDNATLANGNYVVTWNEASDIYAKVYNSDGTTNIDKFRVNIDVDGMQIYPNVASTSDSGFVIAWSGDGVFAQKFHLDGSRDGEEFRMNQSTSGVFHAPSVVKTRNNGFVTSWRVFNSSGNRDTAYRIRKFIGDALPVDLNSDFSNLPNQLYQGDSITMNIDVSGENLYGVDAVLTLDNTNTLKITDASYADFIDENDSIGPPSQFTNGQWLGARSLKAPDSPKTDQGTFATVVLSTDQAGTANLTLRTQLVDQQGTLLLDKTSTHAITVKEALRVTGNVAHLVTNGNYDGVRVYINGVLVHINADGSFEAHTKPGEAIIRIEINGFLPAEKTLQLAESDLSTELGAITLVGGDANNDEQINISDLTLLLAAYRSTKADGPNYVSTADYNRDEQINIQDLTILGSNYGKSGPQGL
ncbi:MULTISPECIES: dockerin type I domain-containing protein [Pseudoalteromonas]|uniref:Dockerin domain-containing protein n=1 Tax=Pseudoalteromonas amylolytica TaxID=1859457 RepID=A0A1S1MWJ2_9GAMM|nr:MULTISPECIES: dockerin type I domain-containing protein [Pseudoalteromonas]OHU88151.1 hypothetical protein BFC16_12230 [Pseudoalteromonas sp. JW3]OHU91591.1 hypothetical protein BET10_12350 [Pseudoalteromonas amylolytica]